MSRYEEVDGYVGHVEREERGALRDVIANIHVPLHPPVISPLTSYSVSPIQWLC